MYASPRPRTPSTSEHSPEETVQLDNDVPPKKIDEKRDKKEENMADEMSVEGSAEGVACRYCCLY